MKNIFSIILVLLVIISIGVVSAEETNITFEDIDDNLYANSGSYNVDKDFNSFSHLNTTINNESADTVKLLSNYKYDENDSSFKSGIIINKSNFVVDGQGHFIDCNNQSKIFKILGNNVSLKNIVFKGSIDWEGSYGILDNCTFLNCTNVKIEYLFIDGDIIISGSTFSGDEDNLFIESYLIYWTGSFGNVTNCNFINCKDCGAFNWIGSNGIIFNSTFVNCSGNSNVIYVRGENSRFKDCLFKNCKSHFSTIQIFAKGTVYLVNSSFINCIGGYRGGAIYWIDTKGYIINSSFLNCSNDYGGAVYWFGNSGCIFNSTFANNHAKNKGGAILWENYYEKGNIINCQFINNTVDALGSTIDLFGGMIDVNNSNFTNNIVDLNEFVTLNNCIFTYTDEFSSIFNNLKPNSQINLTKDYNINWDLQIDVNNITINGNGHKLTALKTKKLSINAANVTFKDIQFENICFYWNGDCGLIQNCNFINYTTSSIVWYGRYGVISSSIFNNASVSWKGDFGNIFNCNFSNFNTDVYGGGGVIHWSANHGNINKSSFINCSIMVYGSGSISGQYFGGGVIYCMGVNNSIVDCSFINCKNVNYYYGLIYYLKSNNGEIIKCNFTNCTCVNGGAISCWDSTVNINNCNFIKCNASYGGAINWIYVNGSIEDCNFINSSSTYGGAIYLHYSNVNIIDCNFTNNTADLGNAIYSHYTNGDIDNAIFINNDIYDYNQYLKLNNCVFNITDEFARLFDNLKPNSIINITKDYIINFNIPVDVENITIIGNGHILDVYSTKIFTITSPNITLKDIVFKISKSHDGGIIYWDGSDGNVLNCSFINSFGSYGGSISWNGVRGKVVNSTFINCSSQHLGHAISWNGNYGQIINSRFINCINSAISWSSNYGSILNSNFINCTCIDNGGAIRCYGSYSKIVNCNFTNCYSKGCYTAYGGGAIYCSCTHGSISNCNFVNCSSNHNGGAIHCSYENSTIFNCTFINCSSKSSGGAIYIRDLDSKVLNSRFINCTGSQYAGAIYFDIKYGKYSCVLNCNFTNCTSGNYSSAIYWIGENGSVIGCICDNVLNGGNNISYKYFNFNLNKSYEIKLGENLILKPITEEDVTGYVEVYIDGVYRSLVFKASESFTLSNLNAGNHIIEFIYLGSSSYGRNKYTFNLIVTNPSKISSKINALNVNTIYNKHKYLTVTLKDNVGNVLKNKAIIISINAKKSIFYTDLNGQINIETKEYTPALYNVVIDFMGDDNYTNSSKTVQFTVKKQTPTLKVSKKTFKVKVKSKKFQLTLKNNNGAIKNAKVILKINSKNYKSKTNNKGVATFKVKLNKKGNYKATVKFAGNKLYNSINKSITISVKR